MSSLWASNVGAACRHPVVGQRHAIEAGVRVYTLWRQADLDVVVKTPRADFVLNYSSAETSLLGLEVSERPSGGFREPSSAANVWFSRLVESFVKIAQIAPLMESVPPRGYGGSERVVSYLTEELVRLGHDVTLFASGDSVTSARLVSCVPTALRLDPHVHDPIPYYMLMLDRVRASTDDFDILHFHIDQFHFPLFRPLADRTLTTLHGRQDLPDLRPLYFGFSEMPLVSISDNQRAPIRNANFVATVHHGLPVDLLHPTFNPRGGYLAFLGRISPEKGVDRSIIAARTL